MTFAAAQANALKGAGSHVFAIGVGAADTVGLAAITGGAAGTDVGTADYSVGNAGAVADSLNALATDDCAVVAAADVGLLAAATDFPNTGAIAIPAHGLTDQIGPASPYPSTITVSGMTGLVTNVALHLFGVSHGSIARHRHAAGRAGRSEPDRDVGRRQRRTRGHGLTTPTSPSTIPRGCPHRRAASSPAP